MTTSEIIALCALAVSALMALLSMRKGTRDDAEARAEQKAQLGSIAGGVDEIRADMRSLRSDISAHTAKLAELEASSKSAHRRLDEIFALYRKAHPPDGKYEG